ncbi:hypothetical protein NQ318_009685 [Aromia moschata]|uniref:Checkpoint protein RAD24-like helical bundle domain-containing protein n=1 Tax=Aromia moschata TaxID=1265417 RepID=A0AAV8XC11_9CUCU|nr:hypothetical protein NQ318_009685 [Aromia moschata]
MSMKNMHSKTKRPFDFGAPKKNNLPIRNGQQENHRDKKAFNFHNELAPKFITDLAVHPKKIQELEEWLKLNVLRTEMKYAPLLLITGPTGSGKTSTINILCKKIGISITEWVNPVDQDYELFRNSGQLNNFMEFLSESKWNSLFDTGNNKNLTLVKDFPNAVIHQPEEFFNVLEMCYYKTNRPIVFICTDSSSSDINLSRSLFPEDIIVKYSIAHISFNACASSLMKAAVKRAKLLVQEYPDFFKQPSSVTVDAILASSMGDIRNAINQFYFASLIGTEDLPTVTSTSQNVGNKRKRSANIKTIQCMSRDENLGLFHGLGRVLNPKRNETNNSWRLNCNVEKLIDEFSIQPTMFTSFLFENYLKYFGDINDASRAAEILSFSVMFLDNWNDRYETLIFGLWISVLGLMIFNEHRVSKWNQIRGPTKVLKKDGNGFNAPCCIDGSGRCCKFVRFPSRTTPRLCRMQTAGGSRREPYISYF